MSTQIHKHIYCDECREPFDGAVGNGSESFRQIRRRAKLNGWSCHERRNLDYCDGCLKDIAARAGLPTDLKKHFRPCKTCDNTGMVCYFPGGYKPCPKCRPANQETERS